MNQPEHTTAAVERCLQALADAPHPDPVVRELLGRSAARLEFLCRAMLYRSYPRLAKPPHSVLPEEMLSAVVERLIKAMRQVQPAGARQFFALANQHMRWELNDLARRLDQQESSLALIEHNIPAQETSGSPISPNALRMLEAIEQLPIDEREVFDLIRIQGMTQPEAAELLGVSVKTVQRRLARGLLLLSDRLSDLKPAPISSGSSTANGTSPTPSSPDCRRT